MAAKLYEIEERVFRDTKFNFSIGKATAHSELSRTLKVTVFDNFDYNHATAKLRLADRSSNNRQYSPARPE
jgi:hypothetical protein